MLSDYDKFKPKDLYEKPCSICKNPFTTRYERQNICSFICREEAARDRARKLMRRKRADTKNIVYPPCEACGYDLYSEMHHEGLITVDLCKTCHSLITRGIYSLVFLFDHFKKPKT